MLVGNNELHLNSATVVLALTEYLMAHAGEVLDDSEIVTVAYANNVFVLRMAPRPVEPRANGG